jgi:arylsulfatase A-like enzyme
VIFTSDNGAAEYADADGRRNAPFTGHKRNLYEGGIRLPYLLRWPARVPAGVVYPHPVSTLDLLPTLLGAAGGEPAAGAGLDGVDLVPYLTGAAEGAPHRALYWRTGPNGAVRRGDWKLLLAGIDGATGAAEIVRLYDLAADPGETRDVAGENPAVVAELRAAWKEWTKGLEAPRLSSRTVVTRHSGDVIRWQI